MSACRVSLSLSWGETSCLLVIVSVLPAEVIGRVLMFDVPCVSSELVIIDMYTVSFECLLFC